MTGLKVPLGSGRRACGCALCGEVFTSLKAFDLHWRNGHRHPADAGLHQRRDGKWSSPRKEQFPWPR